MKESQRREKYWKIEEVNFSFSFFDSTILDTSVKSWDFSMFSHLPQVELFYMLPTASPSPCPHTTALQLTLSDSCCPSLKPTINILGKIHFILLVLRIMGTEHLVAAGEWQTPPLTSTVCQTAGGKGTLSVTIPRVFQEQAIPNAPMPL